VADVRHPDTPAADGHEAVVHARDKFSCPACGGEAHWNPGKRALICPYCGTESPAELQTRNDDTVIVEHDLAAALRSIPDSARGWQTETVSVQCQSCRAISVFEAAKISKNCEFCGSTALVPYEQVKDAFRPESLIPLKVSETRARELIRAWYGRQWFAPNGFAGKALTDTVKGLYLPYWTFDAHVHAHWTAESGTYYTVRVNNKTERRVQWRPASGELSHFFDDDLVGASLGVHGALLRAVEPFPTNELVPYDAGYLSGWTVERYQIDLVAAASRSRQQMDAAVREMCARQIPGDTYRNLVVSSSYSGQTFKHILAPVWILTYVYHGKSFQVLVNGVTGAIAGERPWSWIKIALVVLLGVIVLLVLVSLSN
jgi:Zn finger protein HypA/HybF involved in hydrogenase expression